MEIKLFEVRDERTCIPVVAIGGNARDHDGAECWILNRAGWADSDFCYVMVLSDGRCQYDPNKWGGDTRTMPNAHQFIVNNWNTLKSGDVVDVRVALGETSEPAKSDRFY